MSPAVREHLVEAAVGLAVVLAAIWFVVFAVGRTGGAGGGDRIHVTALFPAANGVAIGTDVRIAGMKVGTVAEQRLEPKSFQAEVTLALDGGVPIPSDSSAAITSESLLGGSYVALLPGGSPTALKDGDAIIETQGSVDMMSLVGSVINRSGNDAAPEPATKGLGTLDESPSQ
jgi:phospholipid/cholesterol/gamma-HCH transport system substrate-binding protein